MVRRQLRHKWLAEISSARWRPNSGSARFESREVIFPAPLPLPYYEPRSLYLTVLSSTPLTSFTVLVTETLAGDKCIQNCIRISFRWRSHLENPKCRREDNNKIDLKKEDLELLHIAHYSVRGLLFSARRWTCGCRKSLEIFYQLRYYQLVKNKSAKLCQRWQNM